MEEIILCNVTYNEMTIGQTSKLTKTLTNEDIALFGYMTGDVNPAHFDHEYAKNTIFQKVVAHGMWSASLISTVLGTQLPGIGTIYLNQSLKFSYPIFVGDEIVVEVKVLDKMKGNKVILECKCTNQNQQVVTSGTAEAIAPTDKIEAKAPKLSLMNLNLT